MAYKFLNVGGGNRLVPVPVHYGGWEHHILDIDPTTRPDVLGDGRKIAELVAAETYVAIYCSHNIEHYYPHDVD